MTRLTPIVFSLALALTLGSLAETSHAQSQYEVTSGRYTVYYSLFPSTFIEAEVAEAYQLTRGKNKAILNIAVRENLPEGGDQAKAVQVSGTSSDLIHKAPLKFTEIREQGAIYYLAQITITGTPTLYFDLKVQANPNESAIPINFKQQVFTD